MLHNPLTAYQLLWRRKKSTFLILLADLLFFLSFTAVFYFLQERLSNLFLSVSGLLSMAGTPTGSGEEAAQQFLSKFPLTAFVVQFAEIIELFAVLIGAGLVLWILFEGVAWKKSYALTGKKVSWPLFYGRFSLATLFWSVVFFATLIIAVKVSSWQLLNIFPVFQTIIKAFFGAVFGILTYFGFVSCCLLDAPLVKIAKNTFVVGYTKALRLSPLFLIILLKIYAALWLVKNSLAVALWLPLVLFLVLLLPIVAWSRIAFLETVKK